MPNNSLFDNPIQREKYLALAEKIRLQECVINATNLALFTFDSDGIITSFNPSAEKLLGYDAADVVGKLTVLAFYDRQELLKHAPVISRDTKTTITGELNVLTIKAKNQKEPDRKEWTLIRKDKTSFPATVTTVALRNDDGAINGFVQIITDHDENLRFFNNLVNLNAISDFEGTLLRMSPSWTRLVGRTEAELKSRPFLEFIYPADVALTQGIFESLISGKRVPTFENRVRAKDGSLHWLLWSAAVDVNTKLIFASAIDITERKKSEENILDSKSNLESLANRLQEQNRQLDEFAHIISHNLRAPVNNIQALINLLTDTSDITDYKLIFDKLKNVSKNLGETMNELMDTLKAKTDPDIDRSQIRFKEILDKVVQSLEGELIVAEASVTFDFNEAPTIEYSKPYLESIFQNLLTNAIKYRSPKRKPAIHFRSSLVNDRVELRVSDNGQGIDMQQFGDKIFGLHKTFHEHSEARGVGLFLIKTQIEAMGGTIRAESEVDKGTTFIITFAK